MSKNQAPQDEGFTRNRRFKVLNDGFRCEHCFLVVPPAGQTCRNHCPFCLRSKHVDQNPGDRSHHCKSLMDPVGYESKNGRTLVIVFRCRGCRETLRNKAIIDDQYAPDDYDQILGLGGIT